MKFTKTFNNDFKNIYCYINNKRVSIEKFETAMIICNLKNMHYNSSSMTHKNNRYKTVFYYN